MHKNLLTLIGLTLLAISSLQAQEIIFNGRDLTGWDGLKEFWSVKDGAITARFTDKNNPNHPTFLIWQGGAITDFDFSCRYRLVPENSEGFANSGIQFRANMTDPQKFTLKGYQGELDPGVTHPKVWPAMANITGCLLDDPPGTLLAAVGQKIIAHSGEMPGTNMLARADLLGSLGTCQTAPKSIRKKDWNEYRIVAVGTHIQIFLNGLQTVDAIDEGNRFQSGLLGLQIHSGGGAKTVQFKDIKLKRLQASQSIAGGVTSPGSSTAGTTSTDPSQPLLETLSQQEPNAEEWALAPLDQSVPSGIRQNLTYLREDLLDEAKENPKAGPEAYKLAGQLCDAMIATLDDRDRMLGRAVFRAKEADARTGVTSEALEARRNYKMSWPQYARETAQREELKSQAVNKAEVMKARPNADWSESAAERRKALRALYHQFREALRQSKGAK